MSISSDFLYRYNVVMLSHQFSLAMHIIVYMLCFSGFCFCYSVFLLMLLVL